MWRCKQQNLGSRYVLKDRFYISQLIHQRLILQHIFFHITYLLQSICFQWGTMHIYLFLYHSRHLRGKYLNIFIFLHLRMFLLDIQLRNLHDLYQFLFRLDIFYRYEFSHHRLYQHRILFCKSLSLGCKLCQMDMFDIDDYPHHISILVDMPQQIIHNFLLDYYIQILQDNYDIDELNSRTQFLLGR